MFLNKFVDFAKYLILEITNYKYHIGEEKYNKIAKQFWNQNRYVAIFTT